MHWQLTEGYNNTNNNNAMLEIDVAHLGEYDGSLLGYLRDKPATILPVMELAATDALDTLLYEMRKEVNNEQEDNIINETDNRRLTIQILLTGNLTLTSLRGIKSEHMHQLIKCHEIVISAAPVCC